MSKKNKFSPADKYRIALEAIRGNLTQAQITAKYRVHATQIAKWKKQALEYLQASFSNKLETSKIIDDYEGQLSELYKQIGQLKVENDFLKKNVMCLTNRHELLTPEYSGLSLREQCLLLQVNRSSYYYEPRPIKPEVLA